MNLIVAILKETHFSRQKNVLYRQPGLRAAAKYWGNRPLPKESSVIAMSPEGSNAIYSALQIVGTQLKAAR